MTYEEQADKQISEQEEQELVEAIKSRKQRLKAIKKEIAELEKEAETKKEEIKKLNDGDRSLLEYQTVTLGNGLYGYNVTVSS